MDKDILHYTDMKPGKAVLEASASDWWDLSPLLSTVSAPSHHETKVEVKSVKWSSHFIRVKKITQIHKFLLQDVFKQIFV